MTFRLRASLLVCFALLAFSSFAATFTVSDSGDSGPGTLRQAILDANGNAGADSIVFTVTNVVGNGAMPQITGVVTIDGTVGSSRVLIGGAVFAGSTAFDFAAGAAGSTLRNVRIDDYPNAVRVNANNVTVQTVDASFLGLVLNGNNNLIGGSTASLGNRFILLSGAGDNNQLFNNRISNVNLITAMNNRFGDPTHGNTFGIVQLTGCPGSIFEGNTIGGGLTINDTGTLSTGTRIYGNTFTNDGIAITSATPDVEILGNSINNVSGLPIDLGNDGPTPNDAAPDADNGANHLQNFPVLTSATYAGGSLRLQGTLTTEPLYLYRIEVFSDDAADAEARTFLGGFNVQADPTGVATFDIFLPTTLVAAGEVVTATATHNILHDTSEVSAPVLVTMPGTFDFSDASITVNETDGTATLTVTRNGGSEGTVTVDYTTGDGSATAPSDYTTTSGTLTFGQGVTSQQIVIPIVNDGVPEVSELFTVTLSNPTGGAAIGTGDATVTIAGQLVADATVPTLSQWGLIVMAIGLAIAMIRATTV